MAALATVLIATALTITVLTTTITTVTVITTGTIPARADTAHADFTSPVDFTSPADLANPVDLAGTVALSNCSGAIVRPAEASDSDPALVLTNGHCLEGGFPNANDVLINKPSQRVFTVLSPNGTSELGKLSATKLLYATMKNTDIALYQTNISYLDLRQRLGTNALRLSTRHPEISTPIAIPSGYWKTTYSCTIDSFVPEIREGPWVWKDSIRYSPECQTIDGTSGAPIVDRASGEVIGINNTGNDDGQLCTENNPCEVTMNGQVTVHQGINYGQETYLIQDCISAANELDLNKPDCTLPTT
jgi:V8-like Glu-specific endopeptidase